MLQRGLQSNDSDNFGWTPDDLCHILFLTQPSNDKFMKKKQIKQEWLIANNNKDDNDNNDNDDNDENKTENNDTTELESSSFDTYNFKIGKQLKIYFQKYSVARRNSQNNNLRSKNKNGLKNQKKYNMHIHIHTYIKHA